MKHFLLLTLLAAAVLSYCLWLAQVTVPISGDVAPVVQYH